MGIVQISPRLTPGVCIGGTWVSVTPANRADRHGRPFWRWYIDLSNGKSFTDSDLSGWGNARAMLESLLAFLGACAESLSYGNGEGENASLFPRPVGEWALQYSDEIGILQIELADEIERERD